MGCAPHLPLTAALCAWLAAAPAQAAASPCGAPATAIHAIQGRGAASPMHGRRVVVEAIVVGDFQGAGRLQGFFLQQADDEADHDPATSEGLFVYDGTGRVPVAVGDRVRVAGTVREFGTAPDTLTELSGVKVVKVCGSGHTVTPAAVSLPVSGSGAWKRVEGMAVRFTQTLTVTGNHDLGRYGAGGTGAGAAHDAHRRGGAGRRRDRSAGAKRPFAPHPR